MKKYFIIIYLTELKYKNHFFLISTLKIKNLNN